MEEDGEQQQSAATAAQQESCQQLRFHCSEQTAAASPAHQTSAGDMAIRESCNQQPAEGEYINLSEAVDADFLMFGHAESAGSECISDSSSDDAAHEDAKMAENLPATHDVNSSTTSVPSLSAHPITDAHSHLVTSASDDNVDQTLSTSGSCTEGSSTLRTSLEVSLTGAQDAICCVAVATLSVNHSLLNNNTGHQHGQVLVAALGACDDACRMYVLPASARQQQQQHVSANASILGIKGGGTAAGSMRGRKKITGPAMGAATTLVEGQDTISSAAFSFDSKALACGCFDGVVRVYRLRLIEATAAENKSPLIPCRTRQEGQILVCHRPPEVQPAGQAPSAQRMATPERFSREIGNVERVGASVPLAVWRDEVVSSIKLSVELAEELRGCVGDVVDVSFHPRGYALLVASVDHTAWVWLLPPSTIGKSSPKGTAGNRSPLVLTVFAAAAPLTCCCFSSSGREGIVGAADGCVSVFTVKTGMLLYTVKHPVRTLSLRQEKGQQPHPEPCSVVTLRLSSMSTTHSASACESAAAGGIACTAADECHPVSTGAAQSISVVVGSAGKPQPPMTGGGQQEEVFLGVGYEDGWVMLVRAATGVVFLAEKGHASKAVESIAFARVAAGTRAVTARATRNKGGVGVCYLLVSGGLDGRVLIWDVARKCLRASIDTVLGAPVSEVCDIALKVGAVQQQGHLLSGSGVTRLVLLEESQINLCHTHGGRQQSTELHSEKQRLMKLVRHEWQQQGPLICAGSTNGHLLVLDMRAGRQVLQWKAHAGAVMELTALPAADSVSALKEKTAADSAVHNIAVDGGGSEWSLLRFAKRENLLPQPQQFATCCCCWRVLSGGDDGIARVWRIFPSLPPEYSYHQE